MSPLGAVRIHRGSSNPDANISTLKPAGATGHEFSGRVTSSAPLFAEFVANGAGKSFAVIFRVVPGFSKRKSVKGAVGGALFNVDPPASSAGAVAGAGVAAAALLPDAISSTYVTTCHLDCSGNVCQEGIPFSWSPLVMNQNTSPGVIPFKTPLTSDGTFPVPCSVFP